MRRFGSIALMIAIVGIGIAACAPPPTPVLVTLTAPPPTPTVVPVDLSPPMTVGSSFVYADGAELVAVPSGPFLMGHGKSDNPEHQVTLSDYWIYATEVTNHQFSLCVAQGRCTPPDEADDPDYSDPAGANRPVVGVSYDQARAYCNFVNADLPTEAQWEKAARGPDASLYPWGGDQPSCKLLNFNNCLKHTSDVTLYPEGGSYYGALNMAGNVYEWIQDWYDPLYYRDSPPGDPPGPGSGRARVIRSSSYRSNAIQAVAYARAFSSPGDQRGDLGFRCAVTDLAYFAPACQLAVAVRPADLASVAVDCPQISIDVQTTACRYGGGAVVTFNDDHPHDPNASFGGIVGCTLLSGEPGFFPLSYQCRQASTAVLSSSCTYSEIGSGQCLQHYSFNADVGLCQWDGNRSLGIDCPSGEFFDPVHHCCLVSSGKIEDFAVCPAGMTFTETSADRYACLPAETVRHVPVQVRKIDPPVCPGACNLTAETCSVRNLVFCSTTCSCLSVGVKCPTH